MKISICLIFFFILLLISITSFLGGLYFLNFDYTYFFDFELISFQTSMIEITILFDWISLFFLSFVSLISSLVILYSKEYISQDKSIDRFIMLVLIFVLSIFFLIVRPNLIRILLGWDGLGLVSYCLVIYFQNIKSFNAGMLTALSNRIGDVIILLAIAWIINYGSWNFIFYLDIIKNDEDIRFISYLIIIAAITKRAQIPFSAWLPAAIAAPTPVSALVHSSTLVTAGVYLLIRFNSLIVFTNSCFYLLLLSVLTIFIAGLGANFEFDLKKIIALSTLSQLGLIIRILSIGFPILAFFHLLTHALFKALLFICAGVVIHSLKNFQDIRYMGSLLNIIPMRITYFNVANLALCGFPFLAGFYSKDIILELVSISSVNILVYFLFFFSTGLTVCYTLRLIYFSIYKNYNSWSFHNIFDSSIVITRGITGLLLLSVVGGSVISWLIFPTPYLVILPYSIKFITLFVCFIGGWAGWLIYKWSLYIKSKIINKKLIHYIGSIWFLPYLVTIGLREYPLTIRSLYIKSADYGWSEKLGAQNLNYNLSIARQVIQLIQNNSLKIFLIIFFLWAIIFCILILVNYYLNSL